MTVNSVPLSEVAEINPLHGRGVDPATVVSFLGMADVSEGGSTSRGSDRVYSEVSGGYTPFRNGDVLVAKITPCFQNGKIAQAELRHELGAGSTEFHVIRPKSTVDARYLLRFLRQEWIREEGELRMTGSGGQRRVPEAFLRALSVPLPSLAEQQRIAAVLDQVDALRTKRRQAITLLDDLAQSAFLDMFGDPMTAGRWGGGTVADAGVVQLGRQRAPKYQTGAHTKPYLRVANVFEDRIDFRDVLSMDFDESDFRKYALRAGDILLNEGQSTELVGRPAMWRGEYEDYCFQNTLVRFQARRDIVLPEYALALFLRYFRTGEFAKISSKTSSVAHLGAARFSRMPFPVPPMDLQERFRELNREVTRQQHSHRSHLAHLDELFTSLEARSFSGTLWDHAAAA
ncbi:restriction endonuclease subunit S [Streptomyces sp. NPDC059875]|uniref:restriction endonuclease subunit S n=1 Tax=unclassified Streptomyces TaxID=2593676 RepID=UPI0036630B8F